MSEQNEESGPQKKQSKRLLWGGLAILLILLAIITTLSMQAMARSTMQASNSANNIVAVITNSGSTNTPGFTLTLYTDGSGALTYKQDLNAQRFHRYADKKFPPGTFDSNQYTSILTQINDVSAIPDHGCLKSVSFGTTTTITYKGKTSGDLSCLSNQDQKIYLDLKQLVQGIFVHL